MSNAEHLEILRTATHPFIFNNTNFAKCYEFIYKLETLIIYLREYAPDRLSNTYSKNLKAVFEIMGIDAQASSQLAFTLRAFRNGIVHELYPALSIPNDNSFLLALIETLDEFLALCDNSFAERAQALSK